MTPEPQRMADIPAPFYLVDLARLRERYRAMHEAFSARFANLVIAYSYKTNYTPCALRTLHALGAWAEVVSELEYELALRLGVAPDQIVFNGPIKSDRALSRALAAGSLLHVDSLDEAERIAALAPRLATIDPRIGLRINLRHPEGEGHRARSRFGLPLDDVRRAVDVLAGAGLAPTSLHGHLATRNRGVEDFRGLVLELGEAAKLVGVDQIDTIDVGGGFGFSPPDLPARRYPSFDAYAESIRGALSECDPRLCAKRLVIEPGMAMINDCVRFVTEVATTKRVGGRHLAFVDGSIHTVKPTRHGLNLPVRVFDAAGEPKRARTVRYDVVGYTCMDDDYLAIDQDLPELAPGDRLEIAHVGAYTMVFKPRFIRAMPAVWAIDGDRLALEVREESFEDFFPGLEGSHWGLEGSRPELEAEPGRGAERGGRAE